MKGQVLPVRRRRLYLQLLPACAVTTLLPFAAVAKPGTAWLLLGLGTAADRPYRGCALRLRALDAAGTARMLRYPAPSGWAGKTWPYRTPQAQGELLLLALPAGSYEIQDFELIQQTGQTQRMARAQRPLSLRIELHEGVVSYIGHYEAHDQGEQALPRDVLVLSDQLEAAQRPWATGADQSLRLKAPERQLPDLSVVKHPQLLPHLGDR